MYERRSKYFAELLDALGVEYSTKPDGSIDNNKVLRRGGKSLKLYFNEATSDRGAYFAAQADHFAGFSSDHWLQARVPRREALHLKLIPYPGEEWIALNDIVAYAE